MDTKRLFIAMGLSLAILLAWNVAMSYIAKRQGWTLNPPPTPPPASTAPSETQTNAPPTTGGAPTTTGGVPTTGTALSSGATPATQQIGLRVVATTEPATTQPAGDITLGATNPRDPTYVVGLSVDPTGASLDGVTLNQFKLAVDKPDPYVYQRPIFEGDATTRALATRGVTINGVAIDITKARWTVAERTPDKTTLALELANESGPLVRLIKTFDVRTRQATKGQSEGYEIGVRLGFQNLSPRPVVVQTTMNGTVPPNAEVHRGPDRQILSAYDNAGVAKLVHHTVEEFTDKAPTRDLTTNDDKQPIVWFGAGNTYFDAIIRPLPTQPNAQTPAYVEHVEAARLKQPVIDEAHPDEHPVLLTMQTAPLTVAPGQSTALPLEIFFGPKQRMLLNNDYYSASLINYQATLVMTSGMCGFCTFQWLVDVLVWMLIGFHYVLRDWGLAIIALVCLVRLVLHPIMKRSQVSMMRMGKMGPEMERLKKKYGDDKEAISKAQFEMMKQQGIGPYLGCAPMFLQMPIFIALWVSLQSTFELRHAPFLWGFTWIHDLSQPDRLLVFSQPLNLGLFHLDAINLLPILVAIVSFFNMKFTPQPMAQTPEQDQQRKMMQWMTLIFPLFFYWMPSGLNIYYLTSTSIGIIEGKRIRDHIKQREEADKAGKVIVDAAPTRRGKGGAMTTSRKADGSENAGCLGGVWANLQKKVEEVQREAGRRGKPR